MGDELQTLELTPGWEKESEYESEDEGSEMEENSEVEFII